MKVTMAFTLNGRIYKIILGTFAMTDGIFKFFLWCHVLSENIEILLELAFFFILKYMITRAEICVRQMRCFRA